MSTNGETAGHTFEVGSWWEALLLGVIWAAAVWGREEIRSVRWGSSGTGDV